MFQSTHITSRLRELLSSAALISIFSLAVAQDTHPARELVERASLEIRTDPELSRRDAQAALEILATRPDADLEIRSRLLLCDYFAERDRPAAEQQIRRAESLLESATRTGLRAGVLECRGAISEAVGDNASARQLYEEAVDVATRTSDDEMLANALVARGYLLGLQGQYAMGLADLKRAEAIFESIDLPQHALTALNGIAILYNRMGDYAQARDMYTRTLKAQRAAGLKREQAVTLHNLARAHENLQEWQQARAAFEESASISRGLGYSRGEAYALRGLAAVANARRDPKTALRLLDRAEALQRDTTDARLRAQIQLARGIALRGLERLRESAAVLEQALQVFSTAESSHELRDTYTALASVYAALGDWSTAYENLTKAKATSERLLQNQIDQRFATLKVEFDTLAKERENAMLLRENEANQKALANERRAGSLQLAVIALTAVLTLMLASLAVHQWRTTRRMRRLAMTDELTGVPNRRAVLRKLEPILREDDASCALLIIDIDHFKQINDRYGHPEGDEALKLVAECLRNRIAQPSFLGRLGGEEFIVVLPRADLSGARDLAEQLREEVMTIDTRRWLADRQITVSIGLTLSVANDTLSTVLQRADAALYEAKRAGRNCVMVRLMQERPAAPPAAAEVVATAPEYT